MGRTAPPSDTVAGRYRITARIASGGMGEVYRAFDTNLKRTVALKILPFDHAARPGGVDRFRAEAQAAARLSHPNVVQVHDWGESGATYFMVMEFVRGRNLREILGARGPLPPRQAADVMLEVLDALDAAHARGLIHRDVKPENVMVTGDGRVKVADFGIARAVEAQTMTGGLLGTVAYVAPEQVRGDRIDPRADLYSAGCVLYELLTGHRPFTGEAASVLNQHLTSRVPAPSLERPEAEPLDEVVAKATHPDIANRYSSASEMKDGLRKVAPALPEAEPLSSLARELTSEAAAEQVETEIGEEVVAKPRRWWPFVVLFAAPLATILGVMFRPVKVPEVEGMMLVGAERRIEEAGLSTEIRFEKDEERAGTVLRVDPPPGSTVLRGRTLVLTVSRGPDITTLDDLVGRTLEEAKELIRRADLVLGDVVERHDQAPAGRVIDQSPRPGRVRRGEPVNLVVSLGPEKGSIPDVLGKSFDEASTILSEAGFTPAKEEVFADAPAGTVLDQQPRGGETADKGTTVRLVVSKGPEPFAMPDVRGQACAQAKSDLEARGLVVLVNSRSGGACGSNKVLEQDPLPGAQVRKGQEATLYVG